MTEADLNDKWNIHDVVQEAVRTAHTEPSPETRERLMAVEVNQKNIVDNINELKKTTADQHKETLSAIEALSCRVEKALDTKAGIWVEQTMIWAIRIVLAIIITSVMYLVVSVKK